MKKKSCRNCNNINLNIKKEMEGRLCGRYRYGCTAQRSGFIYAFISNDDILETLVCQDWKSGEIEVVDYQKLASNYGEMLQVMFNRWVMWKNKGCPEADTTDGVYLNRIRNGISAMMQQIENTLEETAFPECYYAPLPPVMPADYMVNCQEIKTAAVYALDEYRNNQDYIWLTDHIQQMDIEDRVKSEAYRLLCHVDRLEEAIYSNAYLQMKRESGQKSLLDDMASCKRQLSKKKRQAADRQSKKMSHQIIGQMDIELKVS